MKRILFSLLAICIVVGAKAQNITTSPLFKAPKKNNTWTNKLTDSLFKGYTFKPMQKPFMSIDSGKNVVRPNKYFFAYNTMPVAKLQSNDRMPIIKLHSDDKMPIYNPDHNSLINKTKPTLQP